MGNANGTSFSNDFCTHSHTYQQADYTDYSSRGKKRLNLAGGASPAGGSSLFNLAGGASPRKMLRALSNKSDFDEVEAQGLLDYGCGRAPYPSPRTPHP